MYFLYVLKSPNYNRTYIGATADIKKRLEEHNAGAVRSTRFYRPFILAHKEAFGSKTDARRREILLKKSWSKKGSC